MNGAEAAFGQQFESLTGFSPMGWQRRLFCRFVRDDLPEGCDIPTGLGKTSILTVWLLALAHQAKAKAVRLPRRLVYVVNRRTVVDQATDVVVRMRRRLLSPHDVEWQSHADTLVTLAATLRGLCASVGVPLAVSTLRGEVADNEEWKADPARPAIVVGTVDMIGSKLLFSGYGDGRYGRAHHAGLVGHDSLIVHDEAHLTPAFGDLLRDVAAEQRREAERGSDQGIVRPVRVLELSATSRGLSAGRPPLQAEENELGPPEVGASPPVHVIEESEAETEDVVRERLCASKLLRLHPAAPSNVIGTIVKLAQAHHAPAKVLIYARLPGQAQRIASDLARSLGSDGQQRVALLTGTIRGYERDQLVATNRVFRLLLEPEQRPEQTVYLVSTSAGEVGIDLDADHMVCDLTPLDSLIQRLGRVNRRGGRQARVDVVGSTPSNDRLSEVDQAIAATINLLEQWLESSQGELNVSPRELRRLVDGSDLERVKSAFSPAPAAAPLTDILLDSWSLTSLRAMPGRPEVAPFLHGLTSDPPETIVVWRREVQWLAGAQVDEHALRQWFRACRVETRERLGDRTDRVKSALDALLKNHRKTSKDVDFPLVLLDSRGEARWSCLSEVALKDFDLAYRTVVLPTEAGGLDRNGMLEPSAVLPEGFELDVAELSLDGEPRERWLHYRGGAGERTEPLTTQRVASPPSHLHEKARLPLRESEEETEDAVSLDLVLFVSPRRSALENPETASAQQTLEEHTTAIVDQMDLISRRLRLPESTRCALVAAARWHDRGKDSPIWQRYARNEGAIQVLAKARRYLHPRALGGYRHEFGSLLESMADQDLALSAERDLVLHLVAAHHGWARPHFEPRSYDSRFSSAQNDAGACETLRRFGVLQQRFGRWGLAWLESLVRCADIAASQQVAEAAALELQEASR